jgi:integrase
VFRGEYVVTNAIGRQASPQSVEEGMRKAKSKVQGLPPGFRFHDFRHYYASMLIAEGCDVKVVQARLRHASAKTTLDTYGDLWPDSDDSTRAAVEAVFLARADYLRTQEDGAG